MRLYYILDSEGTPKGMSDVIKWAKWFEGAERAVARTEVSEDVEVSTVFLGIDHAFTGGPPILWETMVFGGDHDGYQDRYTSRADALAGHELAVCVARGEVADPQADPPEVTR